MQSAPPGRLAVSEFAIRADGGGGGSPGLQRREAERKLGKPLPSQREPKAALLGPCEERDRTRSLPLQERWYEKVVR